MRRGVPEPRASHFGGNGGTAEDVLVISGPELGCWLWDFDWILKAILN